MNYLEGIDETTETYKKLSECITKGKNYIDNEFKASLESLCRDQQHKLY